MIIVNRFYSRIQITLLDHHNSNNIHKHSNNLELTQTKTHLISKDNRIITTPEEDNNNLFRSPTRIIQTNKGIIKVTPEEDNNMLRSPNRMIQTNKRITKDNNVMKNLVKIN